MVIPVLSGCCLTEANPAVLRGAGARKMPASDVRCHKEASMESVARDQRGVRRAGAVSVEAAVTIALIVLAGLALDDITTDNSTGFKPEYTLLAACGAWSLFLAYDLLTRGYRWLGATSMVAVASAVWVASDGFGHKREGGWSVFWPEYTVMLLAWLWFLTLAIVLVALGWRVMPIGDATAVGSQAASRTR
jgi:hypothetical protein